MLFSVVTTAKNERDEKFLKKVFENWELAKQIFEEKFRKSVEFIFVDAGNNAAIPELKDLLLIDSKVYSSYKEKLYDSGKIAFKNWDSPSIGRNLGAMYAKGKIIVFQDADCLFSTGTEEDYKYISSLDSYENFFEVMYKAFKFKPIIGAAPSLRAMETKNIGRRFGLKGLNYMTWLTCKLPSMKFKSFSFGPSVPGCSFALLKNVLEELKELYNPRLAMAEDHDFSRRVGKFGKISYENKAGVFIRTSRVSEGFDLIKSLAFALKWAPYYLFPELWEYKKYDLRI